MELNISEIRRRQAKNRRMIVAEFYRNLNNYIENMYSNFYTEDKLNDIVYTDRLRYLENSIKDRLEDFENDIPTSFFDLFNKKMEINHYVDDKYIDFRSGINILSDIKHHLEEYSSIGKIEDESSEKIDMNEFKGTESVYA